MIPLPSADVAVAEASGLAVPVAVAAQVVRAASVPAFLAVGLAQVCLGPVEFSCSLHRPSPHGPLVAGPNWRKLLTGRQTNSLFLSCWTGSSCSVRIPPPIVAAGTRGYLTSSVLCHFLSSFI